MNLQQFEKLLREHLPAHKVRKVIRIYLDIVGEEAGMEQQSQSADISRDSGFKGLV